MFPPSKKFLKSNQAWRTCEKRKNVRDEKKESASHLQSCLLIKGHIKGMHTKRKSSNRK